MMPSFWPNLIYLTSRIKFLQLCSLARDMDYRIKVEIFLSLEKIKLVSENVLLQSLTKKVKIDLRGKGCGLPASAAAGVFLQGLEDEFYEVSFHLELFSLLLLVES